MKVMFENTTTTYWNCISCWKDGRAFQLQARKNLFKSRACTRHACSNRTRETARAGSQLRDTDDDNTKK